MCVYQICPSSKRFERVVVSNIMFSFNMLYANIREHCVCEIGPVPSHWMKNRCRILDLLNGATPFVSFGGKIFGSAQALRFAQQSKQLFEELNSSELPRALNACAMAESQ